MDKELREKMIAKARENGDKHGKAAELDFGAGAEWMYEQLVKNNAVLPLVSNRRELLFAFEEYWSKNNCDGENFSDVVDKFLANNSY